MSESSPVLDEELDGPGPRAVRPVGSNELRRTPGGDLWYVAVGPDQAWVAVPETQGGGGAWFWSDLTLNPQSRGWDAVDANDVMARVRRGRDQAAALTAQMLSSCLTDGLGREALALADVLVDHGYRIRVVVDS
jgi:hypothetical protein